MPTSTVGSAATAATTAENKALVPQLRLQWIPHMSHEKQGLCVRRVHLDRTLRRIQAVQVRIEVVPASPRLDTRWWDVDDANGA